METGTDARELRRKCLWQMGATDVSAYQKGTSSIQQAERLKSCEKRPDG